MTLNTLLRYRDTLDLILKNEIAPESFKEKVGEELVYVNSLIKVVEHERLYDHS